MWKSTAKTLLIALSMTTLGTGCDLQDVIDFLTSIQPPPPPVEDCETELDQCLATGVEPERCFDAYGECTGEPPPPPIDPCEQQLNECLDPWGYDGPTADMALPYDEDCWLQYDECIGEEPPPPPIDTCEEELDACLDGYGMPTDPATYDALMPYDVDCWERYDECLGEEPPPPPPIDTCEEELDACLDGSGQPGDPAAPEVLTPCEVHCWEQYDACIGEEPPPPPPIDDCDVQLDDCLNGFTEGTTDYWDPAMDVCYEQYDDCLGTDPVPFAP